MPLQPHKKETRMDMLKNALFSNAKLLKVRASRYAYIGMAIAIIGIIAASLAVSYSQYGVISLETLIIIHRTNVALWFMDVTPFIFAIWGQYVSSMIALEASVMIVDQTNDLRVQADRLEQQSMHDLTYNSISNLPNRALFVDRLTQSLTSLRLDNTKLSVLAIHCEQLKEINDSLGHYNGDRILKQVAVRLDSIIQKPNSLAHISEFEFAAILPNLNSKKEAISIAKKISKAFKMPFTLENMTLNVHPRIGIVLAPEHGNDTETLLQRSKLAMNVATDENDSYALYTEKLDTANQQHLLVINELHKAIEDDLLTLAYQPKINLKSNAVSVEALLRWHHPEYGEMQPSAFVPLAERTGLMKPLSKWVINTALEQCALWRSQNKNISISINISALDLMDIDLPNKIAGQLACYDVPHENLVLEITESAIIKDQERALRMLNQLSDLGIKISIDDFGTGYSSLAYLSRLPASELKIDQSFIFDMNSNQHNEVIVRATIDLAHNLGLKVVAEGVETKEILDKLTQLGCDSVQGFYFSKALPAKDFDAWSESNWQELL